MEVSPHLFKIFLIGESIAFPKLVWFDYEMSPIGSCVQIPAPQMVALFGRGYGALRRQILPGGSGSLGPGFTVLYSDLISHCVSLSLIPK